MKLSRRAFLRTLLSIPLVGAVVATYMRFLEPHWIEVTKKSVRIPHLTKPLRILHLSDFHASPAVSYDYIESAVDTAIAQSPELILLTGDFITHFLDDASRYEAILKKLSAAAPSFACIGNHDGGPWAASAGGLPTFEKVAALLASANIPLLFNQSQTINVSGQPIQITGLGDLWSNHTQPAKALEKNRSQKHPIIVLCHNPDAKSLLAPYDWDLTLCGHTHGGQLVVPLLNYRPFLPVRDKSFAEGLLPYEGRHIHITRGIGNLHGLRFNCRPEISLLELSPISQI